MLSLMPAIGIFSCYAYSTLQQKNLEKTTFAAMQILAEMRCCHGNSTHIPVIGDKMKELDSLDGESWHFLEGDADIKPEFVRVSERDEVAFCYSADGKACALFGRREPSNLSLRDLASKKTTKLEIVEDIYERLNWNQKMQECKPIMEVGSATPIEGPYTFLYRDYVNHEEMGGMMGKRFAFLKLLFRAVRADELKFDDTSKCFLQARGIMFGFIPISIKWEGQIQKDSIVWDTTSMSMGWTRFGKVLDRPPAAEKLRKDNWVITVPDDEEESGDILCFIREGKGRLVFAKDEVLSSNFCLFRKKAEANKKSPVLAL